jgi:hypothetical protein
VGNIDALRSILAGILLECHWNFRVDKRIGWRMEFQKDCIHFCMELRYG